VSNLERRGWIRYGGLTEDGRLARQELEYRTDHQEQAIVTALGRNLDEVCDQLNAWGQLCIEAGAFPPDILKRAAG
jgi:DNA-binding HxlR family transcriptional regulator